MRRNPPAKWTLPDVVNPATSTCWMVPVPDDPFHRAAFLGALADLCAAYKWSDDLAHTAKDVALVWREIVDNLEECPVIIPPQFQQSSDCELQVSLDAGMTWTTIFDAQACADAAAAAAISAGHADGTIAPVSQPEGQGSGSPGVCYDYDFEVNANSAWMSPIAVETNDVITITNVHGGWTDGLVRPPLSVWRCPDGNLYVLATCGTFTGYLEPADPAPTIDHMRLIMNVAGVWYDAYNTILTIPAATALSNVILQANDDPLADNDGAVWGHIQICKGNWESILILTAHDYAAFLTILSGSYVPGQGMVGAFQNVNSQSDVTIQIDVDTCNVYEMELMYSKGTSGGANNTGVIAWKLGAGALAVYGATFPGTGSHVVYAHAENVTLDRVYIDMNSGTGIGPAALEQLIIRGTGTKPSQLP